MQLKVDGRASVAQWVKSLLATLASHQGMNLSIGCCTFQPALCCCAWESREGFFKSLGSVPTWGTQMEFQTPSFSWPSSGCCSHLETEAVDGRISVSCLLSAFQMNKSFEKLAVFSYVPDRLYKPIICQRCFLKNHNKSTSGFIHYLSVPQHPGRNQVLEWSSPTVARQHMTDRTGGGALGTKRTWQEALLLQTGSEAALSLVRNGVNQTCRACGAEARAHKSRGQKPLRNQQLTETLTEAITDQKAALQMSSRCTCKQTPRHKCFQHQRPIMIILFPMLSPHLTTRSPTSAISALSLHTAW